MSQPLPRFIDTSVADERQMARISLESGMAVRETFSMGDASAADLRGIPVIGRGVGGEVTVDRRELGRRFDRVLDSALRMDWLG